jgi:uncharacterized membrane protein YkvA (DUF1232 family)
MRQRWSSARLGQARPAGLSMAKSAEAANAGTTQHSPRQRPQSARSSKAIARSLAAYPGQVRGWLTGLGIAVGCVVLSWLLLLVLARRLPPGLLKDLASFIPDCVTTIRRLRKDPRVPRRAKVAIVIAGIWVASPIDLIPEFIPIIGPLDDIVVVALALRYAARQVPRDVVLGAWPGERRLIERLLGSRGSPGSPGSPG